MCVAAVMGVYSGTVFLQSRFVCVPGAQPSLAAVADMLERCADALDRSRPRTAKP